MDTMPYFWQTTRRLPHYNSSVPPNQLSFMRTMCTYSGRTSSDRLKKDEDADENAFLIKGWFENQGREQKIIRDSAIEDEKTEAQKQREQQKKILSEDMIKDF